MSNRRKPAKTSPLRAALAAKTSLRTYFDLSIVDTETVEAAQRQVAVAEQLVAATLLSDDEQVTSKAQALLEDAKAKRAACFHRIWFRGLGGADFDALVALHPPTDAQRKDQWAWNPDTFNYALIEACVVDNELTAEEWEAELNDAERWTRADKAKFINMCLACNRQTMADAVPKD